MEAPKNFLISRQLRFCHGRQEQQHTDFCTAPVKNNESFTCCGPDSSIYTFPFLGLEKFRKIAACESIFCIFVYIFFFFSLVVFVWCVCCGGTTKSWLTVHSRRVASRLSKSRSRAASDKSQSQNLASLRPGQTHRAAQSTQHSTEAGRRTGRQAAHKDQTLPPSNVPKAEATATLTPTKQLRKKNNRKQKK